MAMDMRGATGDLGLLVMRAMVGFVGIFHGAQKLFGAFGGEGMAGFVEGIKKLDIPMPTPSAWAAAIAEFAGGILVMLGLFTRVGAAFFAFTMAVAFAVGHKAKFSAQDGGGEYPLTLCAVLIGLMLTGGGRFSLDAVLWRKKGKAA